MMIALHRNARTTPAQEHVVVQLRRTLLLPLDDLLAVTREFLCPKASRSGIDRCLRRHGVGNLNALKPATPREPHKRFKRFKRFKRYEPGTAKSSRTGSLPRMPGSPRVNMSLISCAKTHHFHSGQDLEQTMMRYVTLYNHQLPQSALKSKTPMQAMKKWYASRPDLFHKRPYDRPGCDT